VGSGGLGDVVAAPAWRALVQLPPTLKSSMQKDVAAGLPPELDAIAGPILRGGAHGGVDVPVTRDLHARIAAIVSGASRPTPPPG
jgi:ketopantoate reductase